MSCFYFLRTFRARGETANKHWILFLLQQESALETLAMLDSVLLLTSTSGYLNASVRNGILLSFYSPYTFKTDNTFVIKHLNYSRDLLQCFVRLRATYYKAFRMSFRKVLSKLLLILWVILFFLGLRKLAFDHCYMTGLILSFLHILSGMCYMCACIYVYVFAGTSHMVRGLL